MTVHFFIDDQRPPVVYDYDLSIGGALTVSPMFLHRAEDVTLVVLRRAENGPTAAQLQRITRMKAEHPDVGMHFHFERQNIGRMSTAAKSDAHPVSVLGERLAMLVRALVH